MVEGICHAYKGHSHPKSHASMQHLVFVLLLFVHLENGPEGFIQTFVLRSKCQIAIFILPKKLLLASRIVLQGYKSST